MKRFLQSSLQLASFRPLLEGTALALLVGSAWSCTVLAAVALLEYEKFDSEAQAKKNIVQAIESVAKKLGNTPTICRKCYVHPAVIESYLDGTMLKALRRRARQQLQEELHSLRPEEAAVLALLQQRLQTAAAK